MKIPKKVLVLAFVVVWIIGAAVIGVVIVRESPKPPPIGAVIFASVVFGFGIAVLPFAALGQIMKYIRIAETMMRAAQGMPTLNDPDEDDTESD